MIELPFWVLSPSPFTWAFWVVMTLWGHLQLRGKITFKRWNLPCGIVYAAMILGSIVFFYDSLWILGQWLRFGEIYPGDLLVLQVRLIQNLGFFVVCSFFVLYLREKGIIKVTKTTYLFLALLGLYFLVWFALAPDPSFTDWTFAFRFGYSGSRILEAYSISHLVGKGIQGLLFISVWPPLDF